MMVMLTFAAQVKSQSISNRVTVGHAQDCAAMKGRRSFPVRLPTRPMPVEHGGVG
ncbi:hypothetical protein Strvi_3723 [Streptomyces violaceusniger Tu 4113]|uniref:Uncharacterized protein n=1 Tax=Streptomyces violaceusniger (strain Tu 4113) TaxID=653045 RepID=G2NTM9_STRV4|nr:hypothetical protein Strvi_3723 [Streptomyces violaceusniger Tu 4113]